VLRSTVAICEILAVMCLCIFVHNLLVAEQQVLCYNVFIINYPVR